MFQEFKEFAVKGNVVDLAVGLVIGGAFGKIVTSFVNDILMPLLSPLMGEINFADKAIVIKEATGSNTEAILLNYGQFINTVIDFIIVAFAIFIVIKQINKLKRKEEEVKEEPKSPTEIELLKEIRDTLQK